MKAKVLSLIAIFSLSGCTTSFLHSNATNQARTVQDILADEVLYNLVIAKQFNDGKTFNGIPSFVTFVTGQSQVQDSITPQLSILFTTHNGGTGAPNYTPQVSGTHQIQDFWSFSPVVDPAALNRLFWLYQSQFVYIGENNLTNVIFRPPPPSLDQFGRPILNYIPVDDTNNPGQVLMVSNQPVFIAVKPPKSTPPSFDQIPGSIHEKGGLPIHPWYSFDQPMPPTNYFAKCVCRGETVYITDRIGFFKFAVLALGGTNGTATVSTSPSSTPFLQQYPGGVIQLRTLPQ